MLDFFFKICFLTNGIFFPPISEKMVTESLYLEINCLVRHIASYQLCCFQNLMKRKGWSCENVTSLVK